MRTLTHLEQRLESAVESFFGAVFRGRLQPAEIARRLERELEAQKVIGPEATVVPNDVSVRLHPDDLEELKSAEDVIVPQLERFLIDLAAERRYQLAGNVTVTLSAGATVSHGTFEVEARMTASTPEATATERSEHLVCDRDGTRGEVLALREPLVIGRDDEAGLRVNEPVVSRRHARIMWDGVRTILEDLDSTNGTFVNGQRVTRCTLKPGDVIGIGTRTLQYRVVRRL